MWQVFNKELVELLRDTKTLFFIIALPMVVFPVLFGLIGFLGSSAALKEHQKMVRYVLVNPEASARFASTMFYHSDFEKVELELGSEDEYINAIKTDKADLVIVLNPNFEQQLQSGETSQWQVFYNGANVLSGIGMKVRDAVDEFVTHIQDEILAEKGFSASELLAFKAPVEVEQIDTADERESFGETLGGFIPYILIPLCLTGAMYPAIDLGAGEKERGTIETLLLTPVSRFAIVIGKFLTITVTAMMTALITIFSMVFWSFIIGSLFDVSQVSSILASVSWFDYVLMVLLLVPVSAIFSAILLAISIYASSFKEAQNYMGPLTILVIFPIIAPMLPGIKLNLTWSLIPISNVALAIKELLKGTIDYSYLLPIFVSTGLFALASIVFCVYWFSRESVLFR
ncbi:ABC transporter permease [Thalassotalea mangrovi]|uniref:ABC transporter permease n=1 Tax=Thalassotalea mangrovi TaxID=2572245 RepID=A0A4U1B617_9GAMM|nr:ABC transporter permease [Thalassotalea mangrovi]TKB45856.1 ABC transporter permease [Thalassotalea mangrovi]